jgi:hypothetical protein
LSGDGWPLENRSKSREKAGRQKEKWCIELQHSKQYCPLTKGLIFPRGAGQRFCFSKALIFCFFWIKPKEMKLLFFKTLLAKF